MKKISKFILNLSHEWHRKIPLKRKGVAKEEKNLSFSNKNMHPVSKHFPSIWQLTKINLFPPYGFCQTFLSYNSLWPTLPIFSHLSPLFLWSSLSYSFFLPPFLPSMFPSSFLPSSLPFFSQHLLRVRCYVISHNTHKCTMKQGPWFCLFQEFHALKKWLSQGHKICKNGARIQS